MESTKENIVACNRLIQRFQVLRFFDRLTAVSVQLLHEALLKCRNLIEAEEVVDLWIAEHPEHPTPADLYELAREIRERDQPAVPIWKRPEPTKCLDCADTGWRQVQKGNVTGVERCSCGAKVHGQYETLGGVA